ncbi:MAG: hypothetical protein K2X65_05290 [Burkholderiaceae bacterium]|jgi:hypothetical protein|nr:hypothetical protein [Burkholderiaceae bacterium]
MLTLKLDSQLEARLLEVADKEHQTPSQIISQLLAQYLASRQPKELLVDIAKDLPAIEAFSDKDPLILQKEMRDEWN